MNIELTTDEAESLADLVDTAIADLSYEIADTDNSEFRAELNDRRERLRDLVAKLRP